MANAKKLAEIAGLASPLQLCLPSAEQAILEELLPMFS